MRSIHLRRGMLHVLLAFILGLGTPFTAKAEYITYDQLSPEKLAELELLEMEYFEGVKEDALKLMTIHFDVHTILSTYTPQVRIIRQRKRQEIKSIERVLYRAGLSEDFVSEYIHRLREDVVDYALDALLEKAKKLPRR